MVQTKHHTMQFSYKIQLTQDRKHLALLFYTVYSCHYSYYCPVYAVHILNFLNSIVQEHLHFQWQETFHGTSVLSL